MNYTDVKNPQWANAEHTAINCDVDFDGLSEEYVPFTAVPSGDYPHSNQIYAECLAGDYGVIAEYVAPVIPPVTAEANKATASQLLADSDWVELPSVSDTSTTPHLTNTAELIAWRASIRAIAVNPTAGDITWPVKPENVWG